MADLIKISDSTSTTSSVVAASCTAVKSAYDLANGKQDKLGYTPVKSVNNVNADAVGNVKLASWQMSTVLLSNTPELGNHAIDVSEHIPSDGEYEALMYCSCSTNSSSTTNVEVGHNANGENDLINMTIGAYDVYTRIQSQTTILPVPQNRTFHLYISGTTPYKVNFYLLGYRRIA